MPAAATQPWTRIGVLYTVISPPATKRSKQINESG
jgi:hypothetical protein